MGWMKLIDDHRLFLIRLDTDVWAEIEHGMLMRSEEHTSELQSR